nr:tyrosine-type recombinase/integrase [Micromonospora avicenniae]
MFGEVHHRAGGGRLRGGEGGRRDAFHDLRHAYATWLVTDRVPINLVQRVMGHEQASTTFNRYTHTPDDYAARVLNAFTLPADDLLTPARETPSEGSLDEDEGDCDLRRSARCAKGRPPSGGDGGRREVRLRGGRAEPTQRSRGVQPLRVCLLSDMSTRRADKSA